MFQLEVIIELNFKMSLLKMIYINGCIEEEVYVDQPQGFLDYEHPNYVYKLKKSLYGMKQAPRSWNDRLRSF